MLSAEVHLKESVVTALGTQDRADLLGVQRQRDRFAFAAIEDGGNLARSGEAFVLRFCRAWRGVLLRRRSSLEPYFLPFVTILPGTLLKRAPALQFPVALAGLKTRHHIAILRRSYHAATDSECTVLLK